jgi:diphthine-ammonia ligase
MRVVVHWSGGKDCCTALHKIIEQGHEVAYLVTYVYMEPYIFHSVPIAELQSKALGFPHLKVKVEGNRFDAIVGELTRLKKEEDIEGIVTGDIDNVHHKRTWDYACKKLDMKLMMPLWDRHFFSLLPGDWHRERVLDIELSLGMKPIISCIDLNHLGREWLGREFDSKCVEDMKPLVGRWGKGIDATGEPGEFHTTVLDAPLFKQAIEITKFNTKNKELDFGGSPNRFGNFLYIDVEEAVLKTKNSSV